MYPSARLIPLLWLLAASCPAATWIVPGVRTGGSSQFRTNLRILNQGPVAAAVTFEILPAGPSPPQPAVQSAIRASETAVIDDVMAALWRFSDGVGSLRITADQPLLIYAVTLAGDASQGVTGYSVPALAVGELLGAGAIGHAIWVSDGAAAGTEGRIGLTLNGPDNSVTAVLFDAGGAEAGRQTFSGGQSAIEIPVNQIAKAALPAGRVEFRVTRGQAAGYALTSAVASGDTWVEVAVVPPASNSTRLIAGVTRRAPTTVRLFNTAATAARVSLSPVGLGFVPADITLNPGELGEIPDVPAEEAPGAIAVQSAAGVIVRARTSAGSVGAPNAISPATLASAGSTTTLIGLRGATATIGFVSTGGASAGLTLKDVNGNVVAVLDAAVALEPGSARETPLAELFPGAEIPDDAVLVISVKAGSLFAYAQITDAVSGDWWIEAF